jgi:hypothetical protein
MAEVKHNKGEAGGYLVGRRHSEGGIKAVNKSTGQPLEMEGGEVVITRNAVSDSTKRSFNGKMMTNREILSSINQSGGGVAFAEGGEIPESIDYVDMVMEYEGEHLDSRRILEKMATGGQVDDILSSMESEFVVNGNCAPCGGDLEGSFAAGGRTRRSKAKVSGYLTLQEPITSEFGRDRLTFYFQNVPFPSYNSGRIYSTASEASYFIKKIFKESFPSQKVSVSSSKFSMGDSVDIYPDDPRGWVSDKAKEFAKALEQNFKEGRFDGMTDSYEYSPSRTEFKIDEIDGKPWDAISKENPNAEQTISVGAKYVTANDRPKFGTAAYDEYSKRTESAKEDSTIEILDELVNEIAKTENEGQEVVFVNPDDVSSIQRDYTAEQEIQSIKKTIDDLQFLIDVTPDYQFEKKLELGSKLSDLYNKYNYLAFKKNKSIIPNRFPDATEAFNVLTELIQVDTDIESKIQRIPPYSDIHTWAGQLVFDDKGKVLETFKDWFGDFEVNQSAGAEIVAQSKVQQKGYDGSPNFAPQIVYHGLKTLKDQFRTFKFPTTYFAVNREYADYFATVRGGEGYVIPFYLNVRNPLDLTPFRINKVAVKDFMDYLYLKTSMTPEELGFPKALLEQVVPPLEVWVYIRRFPKFAEAIKNTGLFDGFHFYENNPAVPETAGGYQTEVWTTFYPNQSKAIYSRNGGVVKVLGQDNSMWFKKGGAL